MSLPGHEEGEVVLEPGQLEELQGPLNLLQVARGYQVHLGKPSRKKFCSYLDFVQRGGGLGVDPNPNTFDALFCLILDIMKNNFLHFFHLIKKVPRRCPRKQGRGGGCQGEFDIVQI